MASMPELMTIRLTFTPVALLSIRLKIAALIIRFGCFIGGGKAGTIEVKTP